MIEINSYEEFFKYIKAFSNKKINLLVILSRGGLAKSHTVEETLIEYAPLIFSGHVTPLSLYKQVYLRTQEDRECFVVFDDVDTLVMNKTNVALLKQICDTKQEKYVRYSSNERVMQGIPQEFETSCKTILLTNNIRFKDKNIEALMTRGHLLYFNPPNEEVAKQLNTWATEKDIIQFMEKFAHFSKNLNMRTYKMAEELKASGIDWRKFVIDELQIEQKLLIIHNLLQKHTNIDDAIKTYETEYKHSRADFYRFKKLYEKYCNREAV